MSQQNIMRKLLLTLLVASALFTSTSAQATVDCSKFQVSHQLDPLLTLDYVATAGDDGQGTFKGRLTHTGLAWVGFGRSIEGDMVPGEAIVGSPNGVLKYSLSQKVGSGVSSNSLSQTLADVNFLQNDTHTIVEFTKVLEEDGELPINVGRLNNFFWAYGSSNTIAFHANFGKSPFEVGVCIPPTPSPVLPVPTLPPTLLPAAPLGIEASPVAPVPTPLSITSAPTIATSTITAAPTPELITASPSWSSSSVPSQRGVNCAEFQRSIQLTSSLRLEYVVQTSDNGNDIFSGRLTLEREAWLSFGVTSSASGTNMFPSDVVVAKPGEDESIRNPGKYFISARRTSAITLLEDNRQTLINATIKQENGRTIMTFHKILVEENEIAINGDGTNFFIFAYGSSNNFGLHAFTDRGAVRLTLALCGSIPGSLSGPNGGEDGVLEIEDYRDFWTSHGIFAVIAWGVLTPLAIASSLLRGFFPDESGFWFTAHFVLNLATFIFTLVACALAVAAVEKATPEGEPANHFQGLAHRSMGLAIMIIVVFQVVGGVCRPRVAPKSKPGNEITTKKKEGRFVWEILHKGAGAVLLAMAWWQVQNGLALFATRFGSTDLRPVFWGVVGSIVAITSLLWVYGRFVKNTSEDTHHIAASLADAT